MKLLIFHTCRLEEGGGPAAYLKHYKDYLRSIAFRDIVFLEDVFDLGNLEPPRAASKNDPPASQPGFLFRAARRTGRIASRLVRRKEERVATVEKEIDRLYRPFAVTSLAFDEYDAIQFHSSWELFRAHEVLRDYEGKILLMSHSPKPWHLEFAEDSSGIDPSKLSKRRKAKLLSIEESAIKAADAMVFPCKEAMEPYLALWDGFGELVKDKEFIFAPTSIDAESITVAADDAIRRELGLSASTVIGFFAGRHNEVKGYDLLCSIGDRLLERWPQLHIVCAGRPSSRFQCQHSRWHELGWRSDVAELMASADFYLLPNRQTYFDLVLLEAMGSALPVVLSKTGGNKYFSKYAREGLAYFDEGNGVSFENAIANVIDLGQEGRAAAGRKNRRIIEEDFSFPRFHENYVDAVTAFVSDHR